MVDVFETPIHVGNVVAVAVSVAAGNGHGISIGPVVKVTDKRLWWKENRIGAYDGWHPTKDASNEVRWTSCGNRVVIIHCPTCSYRPYQD